MTAPSNDDFGNRTLLGAVGVQSWTTSEATWEDDEPRNWGYPNVWYEWRAPADGRFCVNTFYGPTSADFHVTLTLNVEEGDIYYLQVCSDGDYAWMDVYTGPGPLWQRGEASHVTELEPWMTGFSLYGHDPEQFRGGSPGGKGQFRYGLLVPYGELEQPEDRWTNQLGWGRWKVTEGYHHDGAYFISVDTSTGGASGVDSRNVANYGRGRGSGDRSQSGQPVFYTNQLWVNGFYVLPSAPAPDTTVDVYFDGLWHSRPEYGAWLRPSALWRSGPVGNPTLGSGPQWADPHPVTASGYDYTLAQHGAATMRRLMEGVAYQHESYTVYGPGGVQATQWRAVPDLAVAPRLGADNTVLQTWTTDLTTTSGYWTAAMSENQAVEVNIGPADSRGLYVLSILPDRAITAESLPPFEPSPLENGTLYWWGWKGSLSQTGPWFPDLNVVFRPPRTQWLVLPSYAPVITGRLRRTGLQFVKPSNAA